MAARYMAATARKRRRRKEVGGKHGLVGAEAAAKLLGYFLAEGERTRGEEVVQGIIGRGREAHGESAECLEASAR